MKNVFLWSFGCNLTYTAHLVAEIFLAPELSRKCQNLIKNGNCLHTYVVLDEKGCEGIKNDPVMDRE